ncbi:MAG: glutamine synthetase III [Chitinispirillia bacterium]|nr:glutamine synthetase III [Chitinispirillia bacterium]MCL2268822.1 glutamine synthetase III [Chitinispirillia bacterium]
MSNRSDITQSVAPVFCSKVDTPPPVSSYYGVNTFSEAAMQKKVPAETFRAFKTWQEGGAVISPAQADEIAAAMKDWAVERGAVTYSHWFQPMTGLTAEKHEGFICADKDNGGVIEQFTGNKLILGEPDASSFPSGGIRATFEARGYTAWDPSSPAFITEVALGKTLCIPSIFISYTGDALDKKLPLLRSDAAISKAAVDLLKIFGHKAKHVCSTCGIEQEYFLIDNSWYKKRPDLMLAGRTLTGAPSPKGQQLEDQYYGSIKERVLNYMHDVCGEAFKLGIPVTTRHNEVAPNQYEFAPIFERSNLAADNNLLLMDVMKRTALRHNLVCLLHEKPFAGVNGSGKHVNWSLADDRGNNLLNPGDTPEENLLFLTVLVSVVRAMHKHSGLLRAAAASAGNERRLGANEAPPAIMSVFLGEQLTKIISMIESGKMEKGKKQGFVDLGVSLLPQFMRDTTDRNRTSPFAFTGAKFEFRTLGSSMNVSTAVTVINTIVADSMAVIGDKIKKELSGVKNGKSGKDGRDTKEAGDDMIAAVLKVLGAVIKESKSILFEGNNYSSDWAGEAKKRGLQNAALSPAAFKSFIADDAIALFERHKVYSKTELLSRYNIWLDKYEKTLDIEARTLIEMVNTQVLPSAYAYQSDMASGLEVLRVLSDDMTIDMVDGALEDRKEVFGTLTADIYYIRKNLKELDAQMKKTAGMELEEKAAFFFTVIQPQMDHIRRHVDALECTMPDEFWPLPKYREMLFIL